MILLTYCLMMTWFVFCRECTPAEKDKVALCWTDVGTSSAMLAQKWIEMGWMQGVFSDSDWSGVRPQQINFRVDRYTTCFK